MAPPGNWELIGRDADEFADFEHHRRVTRATVRTVVPDAARHRLAIVLQKAAVRDRDAEGVARLIGKHLFRHRKRLLGVDEPELLLQRRQEVRKVRRTGET